MIVQDRALTPIIVLDDNELKSRLEYDENIEINNNTIGRNIEEGADQGQTNKIKYKGDKKGALRHGFGVLYDGDVIIYEGNFSNDEYHGKGRATYENGDIYEGNFSEGLKDGLGVLTETSGAVYNGKWRSGNMLDGCHVSSYPIMRDNVSFQGNKYGGITYRPGVSGRSVQVPVSSFLPCRLNMTEVSSPLPLPCRLDAAEVSSRSKAFSGSFDGFLVNGKPCDHMGVCTYTDGGVYIGAWKAGRRNGQGTYTSCKGDIYKGMIHRDFIFYCSILFSLLFLNHCYVFFILFPR